MRIVHFLQEMNLEQGGVVRAVLDMATTLARRGHDVAVLTHDERDRPAFWVDGEPGVPRVVNLGPYTNAGRRLSPAQVAAASGELVPGAVLHLHGAWKLANNQLSRAAASAGVPYVLSPHGMLDDWSMAQRTLKKRVFLAMGGGATLARASAVHCTAASELSQARRWLGAARERGVVVPYITDLEPFRTPPGPEAARRAFGLAAPGEAGHRPVVLFLSRLHYKKQPDTLMRACALLRDEGRETVLLFAGVGEAGYERELRGVREGLSLGEDACRFLGMVKGDLKLSLYQAADVFALPTSQENFGLVYTESLACGTPIIATRGTDIWQELEKSGAARIAEPTPRAFADAIAATLDDPERVARGARGRSYAMEWLDVERTARAFESMYEGAAKRKASR